MLSIWGEIQVNLQGQGKIGLQDWQTNHRIYDYMGDGHSRDELESLRKKGYAAYIDSFKSPAGATEVASLLLRNHTMRSVLLGNILNPNLIRAIRSLGDH